MIPASEQNPIALNLLAIYPLPNLSGVANNFRVNNLAMQTENQYDVRVDEVLSDKDSMFARFTQGGADITFPDDAGADQRRRSIHWRTRRARKPPGRWI